MSFTEVGDDMARGIEIRLGADRTAETIERTNAAIMRALEACGQHLAGEAQDELENPPRRVDTSNLKNSMSHRTIESEKAVYVGTNVSYGIYVHEGTRRMDPNHFLKNAFERNTAQVEQKLREALGGI